MEPQTALVGADRTVELHAIAGVDLDFALVVHPRNLEDDRTFRNDHAFKNLVLLVLRLGVEHLRKRTENLGHTLNEFLLIAVGLLQPGQDAFHILAHLKKPFVIWNSAFCQIDISPTRSKNRANLCFPLRFNRKIHLFSSGDGKIIPFLSLQFRKITFLSFYIFFQPRSPEKSRYESGMLHFCHFLSSRKRRRRSPYTRSRPASPLSRQA